MVTALEFNQLLVDASSRGSNPSPSQPSPLKPIKSDFNSALFLARLAPTRLKIEGRNGVRVKCQSKLADQEPFVSWHFTLTPNIAGLSNVNSKQKSARTSHSQLTSFKWVGEASRRVGTFA